jgi:phospholipid/cholesterol/gamma-HCH transport system substrate-binding protein
MNRQILVGMLLLGALIIFALGTFYIEDWQYYLRVQKGYQVIARFESAHDLRKGDEVRLAGVEVGRVRDLKIEKEQNPKRPVRATLWIEESLPLREKDEASVEIRSIFGGSYVVITPGDQTAPLIKPGQEIKNTRVGPSLTDVVNRADAALAEARASLATAQEGLESMRNIARSIEQGEGSLGKLFKDEQAYNDLRETLAATRKSFEEIGEGKGLLGKLISDEKLAHDFDKLMRNANATMDSLQKMTADIEQGEGAAGLLLKDKEFAQKLEKIVSDLESFATAMGKVSENFENSTLGKLMTDDSAYKSLTETLENTRKTVASISEGKGTIGKLATDEKVYNQISSTLDSVQKLLDDYREQSPILTFIGAVFGAF